MDNDRLRHITVLGKNLENLGLALQNPKATVGDVAVLAFQCGLRLSFHAEPDKKKAKKS